MYKKCCTVLKPEITPSATQLFLFAFSNAHVFSGDLFTLVPSRDFATSLDFANEPTLLYRPLDRLTNQPEPETLEPFLCLHGIYFPQEVLTFPV